MKKVSPLAMLTLISTLFTANLAHAALTTPIGTIIHNNDTVTSIYGSGNPNESWVTSTFEGITLGVRFKERGTINYGTTDTLGGTTFTVGTSINLDFTVSSGSSMLSEYKFILSVDSNPTVSQTWTTIDITASYDDNSFGTSSTLNGAGTEGTWSALAGTNTVAQNSQRSFWLGIAGNPTPSNGVYHATLTAYSVGDVSFSTPIAQTVSKLNVIPEPNSIALGLGGLALLGLRRRK
jgi:hypothetical protein